MTTTISATPTIEIDGRRVAGAEDEVAVEPPLIERHGDADQRQPPPGDAHERAVASRRPDQRKDQQRQEADVDRPHDLAGHDQKTEGGGDLKGREQDREPEQQPALAARREAFGKRIVEAEVRRTGRHRMVGLDARTAHGSFGCAHRQRAIPCPGNSGRPAFLTPAAVGAVLRY